ncbi:transposase [Streptomyces noursei ATCC 11455]|nr:transposase [Streptomyces noursei ATCC 11455]
MRRTGNRFSVNAMSAISTKGRMHFMVFTETFDADVICRFLDRLAGHFDHKVHLVVDGHSAHRSRQVRAWLADHPDRIELHFLPPYSPELNPDELGSGGRGAVSCAPMEIASADRAPRHQLSRTGDRQLNSVLYAIAVQLLIRNGWGSIQGCSGCAVR